MLPSLIPMLWRYRRALKGTGETHLGLPTTLVAIGYFCVWSALGLAAFPVGVALAALGAQSAPSAVAVLLLMAGGLQFTAWKAHHLACCRMAPGHGRTLSADAGTAWRHGLRCGLHCSYCCAGPTLVLLCLGVMDLRAMAIVMLAITTERLAPAGRRVAHAIGIIAVAAAVVLIARL